jgi:hypothetical protein
VIHAHVGDCVVKHDRGIVDENIETTERLGGFVDRALDRARIGAVGLDGERSAALAFDRPNDLGGALVGAASRKLCDRVPFPRQGPAAQINRGTCRREHPAKSR